MINRIVPREFADINSGDATDGSDKNSEKNEEESHKKKYHCFAARRKGSVHLNESHR